MLDYLSLAAVAAVAREEALKAAAALGVTPSAVSQRIKGLEERLGAGAPDAGARRAARPRSAQNYVLMSSRSGCWRARSSPICRAFHPAGGWPPSRGSAR